MNTGRKEDIKELHEGLSRERNPERRDTYKRIIKKIKNESGIVKSMRESLVKAHRDGNKGNIKDIHQYIKGKQKYDQDQRV